MTTNGTNRTPTDLPAPVVKCGCGFTIAGHLPEDAERILDRHDCPKLRSNNAAGLIFAFILAIPAAAYVVVKIWGN